MLDKVETRFAFGWTVLIVSELERATAVDVMNVVGSDLEGVSSEAEFSRARVLIKIDEDVDTIKLEESPTPRSVTDMSEGKTLNDKPSEDTSDGADEGDDRASAGAVVVTKAAIVDGAADPVIVVTEGSVVEGGLGANVAVSALGGTTTVSGGPLEVVVLDG